MDGQQADRVSALLLGDRVRLLRAERLLTLDEADEAFEVGPAQLLVRPGEAGELALLTGRSFVALVSPPYEVGLWLRQMDQIGVRSLGVASITTVFTGMVLALQTAYSLPQLGVKYYTGTVVSKSLVRELGPVLTALIVGGRVGAGMTAEIGATVAAAMRKLKYRGAGTVEFLYEDGQFYFIEMNTRLQVEHPVTEMITGLDLVIEQIRVASGNSLTLKQDEVTFTGHAIECRINAENPQTFMPSPGEIKYWHPPGGLGVRVDSGAYQGYRIPPYYDSLIGKLIVHGKNRNEALMRLRRCLSEFVIDGIDTTIPLFARLVKEPDIANGLYNIHWLENFLKKPAQSHSSES